MQCMKRWWHYAINILVLSNNQLTKCVCIHSVMCIIFTQACLVVYMQFLRYMPALQLWWCMCELKLVNLILQLALCNSCNIGMSEFSIMYAWGPQAQGLQAYIWGKLWVPMLQLNYVTLPSEELKAAQAKNLWANKFLYFIRKLTRIDCGL